MGGYPVEAPAGACLPAPLRVGIYAFGALVLPLAARIHLDQRVVRQVVNVLQRIAIAPIRSHMTPVQCRMARTLLDLKLDDLAKLSGVSAKSIWSFETGPSEFIRANHEALQRTLERMGAEFLEDDGVKRRRE
jgi:DNA-binding XRE family transcriptional regulator